jgi:hypothetical protein
VIWNVCPVCALTCCVSDSVTLLDVTKVISILLFALLSRT